MYTSVIRPLQFLGGILQVQRGAVRERQKGTGAVGGARVRGRVGQVWGFLWGRSSQTCVYWIPLDTLCPPVVSAGSIFSGYDDTSSDNSTADAADPSAAGPEPSAAPGSSPAAAGPHVTAGNVPVTAVNGE